MNFRIWSFLFEDDMVIRELQIANFRSYKDLTLCFDTDITVLYGQNAQGKTNILESIYLCSCLRSHRTSRDSDLITHDESEYRVYLEFQESDDSFDDSSTSFRENLCVVFYDVVSRDPNRTRSRRVMKHNGMLLTRMSDIIGLFHAVIFAPEDLNIIKEGPSVRRRYMDILISQIRASYFNELTIYQKILMQRNALLKQMRDGQSPRDPELLHSWDWALSASAAKIMTTRADFVAKIHEHASRHHYAMSSGKENINVKYKTLSGITFDKKLEEIQQDIFDKLKTNFNEDVDRGSTMNGCHRDDLEILINGESIRVFASQGQQRTAVLALRIAELEIIGEETGNTPVLLLDDVMSELDETRRNQLMASIGNAQVILTCTDRSHAAQDFLSEYPSRTVRYYKVEAGRVVAG
jgi:DNA replication and repair protein RecF